MAADKSLSVCDGGPRPDPPYGDSQWALFEHGASIDPDHLALISTQPRDHLRALWTVEDSPVKDKALDGPDHLHWTYAQLRVAASTLANSQFFRDHVPPGSTVVTFLPACAEWAVLKWVSALRCLTFVPLDPMLTLSTRTSQLVSYIARLKPALIVVHNEEAMDAVNVAASNQTQDFGGEWKGLLAPTLGTSSPIYSNGHGDRRWHTMNDVASTLGSAVPRPEPSRLDRIAAIVFTSGTSTGQPKGCPVTVKNLLAGTTMNSSVPLDTDSVALISTPNFRIICWGISHNTWKKGGVVVLPSKAGDPSALLEAIERHGVTHVGVVPIHIYKIAKNPNYSMEAVKTVKAVWVGGDISTAGLIHDAKKTFPTAVVCGSHGMTEGLGAFGWPQGVPEHFPNYRGILSCGQVMPGYKVRIVDDHGRLVPRGTPAHLHISSDALIQRYMDNVNDNLFIKHGNDTWFATGDIAVLDEKNHIYVLSRSKDVIKRGGTPITPACIQTCVSEHFGLQCEVIGLPDPEYGELPYCILEKATDHDLEALVIEQMGPDYGLATKHGVLTLEDLGLSGWPLNATNKVVKETLRQAASRYLSSEAGAKPIAQTAR